MNIFLVAIGGFFGAVTRYFVANKLSFLNNSFPAATFFVNLSGSFLLGLIMGGFPSSKWTLLVGIGFLGSYTTFSTFKVEMINQLRKKKWKPALIYMFLSYFGGIVLAFLGFLTGLRL
ncbi:fluoride efflux transporter CrcB [Siminovitchia fordii]|uniref:Fluoride-specific ion channel FluC n=1 Tax=Siminovitchia fordii TaxID=254759 RepID=A0ABQ4K905_9BACI|nr:fluoride efflux transporter CrcB [Siminovitchia fordii]GIN21343.1 putative fluoride ion transporter CrcB 2 [Siminovitchia fordii]